jgi:hypothetical protein
VWHKIKNRGSYYADATSGRTDETRRQVHKSREVSDSNDVFVGVVTITEKEGSLIVVLIHLAKTLI